MNFEFFPYYFFHINIKLPIHQCQNVITIIDLLIQIYNVFMCVDLWIFKRTNSHQHTIHWMSIMNRLCMNHPNELSLGFTLVISFVKSLTPIC